MNKSDLYVGMRVKFSHIAMRTWVPIPSSVPSPRQDDWLHPASSEQLETRWQRAAYPMARERIGYVSYAKAMPVCIVDTSGPRTLCKNKRGSKMATVVWVVEKVLGTPVPVMLEDLELAGGTDPW